MKLFQKFKKERERKFSWAETKHFRFNKIITTLTKKVKNFKNILVCLFFIYILHHIITGYKKNLSLFQKLPWFSAACIWNTIVVIFFPNLYESAFHLTCTYQNHTRRLIKKHFILFWKEFFKRREIFFVARYLASLQNYSFFRYEMTTIISDCEWITSL